MNRGWCLSIRRTELNERMIRAERRRGVMFEAVLPGDGQGPDRTFEGMELIWN